MLAALYPQHFPQGRGMPYDPYRMHNDVSDVAWKRLTFARLSNRDRAQDAMLLDLQNMESKRRMLLHAQLRFKRRGGDARTLTASDTSSKNLKEIVKLLGSGSTRDEVYRSHPRLATMMQDVSAIGGLVPGTVHARKKTRAVITGLATERSALNVWFTLNLDEFGDATLLMIVGFKNGKLREFKTVRKKRAFLETLVARDPAALATWFKNANEAVIRDLFGYDVSSERNVRGRPGRRGIFGTTLDYFAPVECAQRGE